MPLSDSALAKLAVAIAAVAFIFAFVAFNLVVFNYGADQASQARQVEHQCEVNNHQNAVVVAALEEAKNRARSSLPEGNPRLTEALKVLNEQIAALPQDPACEPAKLAK